ncbi:lymphocyte antigen 75-like [Scophthalmus maximus]|uniref:lymphocyte antigen 75-like n=1 Tax=Scophthalmus maximus TaxID=52904 RepID=UPI001FA934BB|nr:lymphocyte antigen 75-like [Scophthalmus maximus]XP_035460896.2 lymphocyte antigen 75-like [Scophthalmus maximus]
MQTEIKEKKDRSDLKERLKMSSSSSSSCSPVCSGVRGAVWCSLLLSGLSSGLHQYHFVDQPKSWSAARLHCRQAFTDLATVDNMADMQRLVAAAGAGYQGKVWIGLIDRSHQWLWSLADRSFYGEKGWDFRRWMSGQPDLRRTHRQLCATVEGGRWYDYPCNKSHTFVCYNGTNTTDLTTISIQRYFFVNDSKSWWDAQAHCRRHHTDLASVRNETENSLIQQVVPSGQRAAIGLHRRTWDRWSDGTSSTFSHWADGHPQAVGPNCVASVIEGVHRGTWTENSCGSQFPFMCHNNKKQLFNIKLTALKPTVDLNQPDVTDAVLNLIEVGMKERGITRGFKTVWIKKLRENIFHRKDGRGN